MGAATYAGGQHTTAAGSKAVTATPAANDLIAIISASAVLASALDVTPTDNQSGTYTRVALAQGSANTELIAAYIRDALIPAATSTIFTHALSASNSGGGLTVYRISGMTKAGATAALQVAQQSGGGAGTTPAPTFGSAVNTANVVLGGVMANQATANAITPPTSYTEGAELTYTTPSRVLEVVARDSGETGTAITWGSTVAAFAAIAVELDTSAGGAVTGVGTSAGTGAATGVGAETQTGAGTSSGAGTAAAVGAGTQSGSASTAGIGVASGIGASTVIGVGSSAGIGASSAAGAAKAVGVGTSAGAGAASGVPFVAGGASSIGTAAGTSTAAGSGTARAIAAGAVQGQAIVLGVGKRAGWEYADEPDDLQIISPLAPQNISISPQSEPVQLTWN